MTTLAITSSIWTDELEENPPSIAILSHTEVDEDPRWSIAYERLRSIAALPNDWNHEGALAPTSRIIEATKLILERYYRTNLEPPSRIVPTPMGQVSIEWESEIEYVEAEINDSGVITWLRELSDGTCQQWNEVVFLDDDGLSTAAASVANSDEATTTTM